MQGDGGTTAEPVFRIPAHVLYRMVDGQMVLLDLANERYFGLNQVATRMLSHVTAAPVDEAVRGLLNDYEVAPEVLRRDVATLLGSLEEAGLLERVEDA